MRKPHGTVGQVCGGCRRIARGAAPGAVLGSRQPRQRESRRPARSLRRSTIAGELRAGLGRAREACARGIKDADVLGGELGSVLELGGSARRAEDRDDQPVGSLSVIPANSSPAFAGLGGVAPAEVAFEPGHASTLGASGRPHRDTIGSIRRARARGRERYPLAGSAGRGCHGDDPACSPRHADSGGVRARRQVWSASCDAWARSGVRDPEARLTRRRQ